MFLIGRRVRCDAICGVDMYVVMLPMDWRYTVDIYGKSRYCFIHFDGVISHIRKGYFLRPLSRWYTDEDKYCLVISINVYTQRSMFLWWWWSLVSLVLRSDDEEYMLIQWFKRLYVWNIVQWDGQLWFCVGMQAVQL